MEDVRKEEKETKTDEIVVRFKNESHRGKMDNRKVMYDSKKSCVGDYKCCGHMP